MIKAAKKKGLQVTCEVAPQNLFLCTDDVDRIGSLRARVKPPICTKEDQNALWENLDIIDCFATDHGMSFLLLALNVFRDEFKRGCFFNQDKIL